MNRLTLSTALCMTLVMGCPPPQDDDEDPERFCKGPCYARPDTGPIDPCTCLPIIPVSTDAGEVCTGAKTTSCP